MAQFESKDGDLYIDDKKVIRGWQSFNGWHWFATEKVRTQDNNIKGRIVKDDTIWYGFVQGLVESWGEFSEAELRSLGSKVWEISKEDLAISGRR